MMNRILRTALLGGHVERLKHDLGAKVISHGPSDDPPTGRSAY